MRPTEPFAPLATLVVAVLATLSAAAVLVATSWVALLTGLGEAGAGADHDGYWFAFLGVVAGALAVVWAARRQRGAHPTSHGDEPALWI